MKEMEKSKIQILLEMIEYVPLSIVSKTIIQRTTGNIMIIAMEKGESVPKKMSPFDTFIQVIEGIAEIIIDDEPCMLHQGQGIIIPAHTINSVKANGRFKMITTVIKSGYEENNL
jgi:quercetin dioxygenase-like cupin family protein